MGLSHIIYYSDLPLCYASHTSHIYYMGVCWALYLVISISNY